MSNQLELTTQYITSLSPLDVASDKAIGEHFVNKFMAMYRAPKEQAVAFYEREKDNFMKRINESEELRSCTPMSIFTSFMQVGGWKLSFEGGAQADVYLIPGNRNIAPKNQPDQWIKECIAQPSPYGDKKIRVETGQIKHVGNPTVVYDCDTYEEYTGENGRTMVKWTKGPRTEKSIIIGSFILLEYPDGSREFKTFDLHDIESWEKASEKKNKGKANALYGWGWVGSGQSAVYKKLPGSQIDKKFLEGKTLKHAFKLFPRVIASAPVPQNFVPIADSGVRQGFDTSEFTEDAIHEDVTNDSPKDEFSQAIDDHQEVTIAEETKTVTVDSDEPDFD